MADGKTHALVGVLAGAGTAAIAARREDPFRIILEALGGAGGGWVGAKVPDWLDPPLHPGHRSVGHGVIPSTGLYTLYMEAIPRAQAWLRAQAQRQAGLARTSDPHFEQLWHTLLSILCTLAAGAIAGVLAGHFSHLVLDAATPMSLPLLA
jgi:hypothetical protein